MSTSDLPPPPAPPPAEPPSPAEPLPAELPPSAEPQVPEASPAEQGTAEASPPPEPFVPAPAPVRRNKFLSWLLVRDELGRAQAEVTSMTAQQRAHVQRAKVAFEMGELALAPGNAVRSGSSAPLAANLFRQSIYWALLSLQPNLSDRATSDVWNEASPELLAKISGDEATRAELDLPMRSTFVEFNEVPSSSQRAQAETMHRVAQRAVAQAQRAQWQLDWSKLKRLTRLGLVLVVLLVPIAVVIVAWPPKPDLAKGKPWHTSSIGIECHPEKSDCGGVTTDILFHTKLEKDPWFEYDFGAPIEFSSLTIKNRSDFGPERAVPLVVEVSNDDKHFRQVARREDTFSTWKPSFTPQIARYLRLRITRESMLHLEAVQVHR